jgi:hypothetical protein
MIHPPPKREPPLRSPGLEKNNGLLGWNENAPDWNPAGGVMALEYIRLSVQIKVYAAGPDLKPPNGPLPGNIRPARIIREGEIRRQVNVGEG